MGRRLHDLRCDHLAGRRGGMAAICSVRREVLEAAMESALSRDGPLLIEATANQVNQFGGYSGMTPAAFAAYIDDLASAMGFPRDRVVLGADHLGPYVWRGEPAAAAAQKALELVRQCVGAGFRKIHLDTGFGCADDPQADLPPETAAERAAVLCRAAESAAERLPRNAPRPLYVIGVEVPPPGGGLEASETLAVTPVAKLRETLGVYEGRFRSARLESAWERVLAMVVQPGVEFGDRTVAHYCSAQAHDLSLFHARLPGIMTYEVHSTDYQPPDCLRRMVADHFTLLKVGPCLTDAFRDAVFALTRIESEQLGGRRGMQLSNLREVLEAVMLENPVYWRSHYRGTDETLRYLRSHSRRDRIRYYWSHPAAAQALELLMANLKARLSPEWIKTYLPEVHAALPADRCPVDPAVLIRRRIQLALGPYFEACA
jgi:D-tagatose-1,6-bisphosphate aldolase subunit GatZ/KbaZ